jgi:hypothetical protein
MVTETIESFDTEAEGKNIHLTTSLNLGLDMWTYLNGENVKLTNFNI